MAVTGPVRLMAQQGQVLSAQQVESTFPANVYYRGKTAPVQLRNAGAVHFGGQSVVFAGLVDTSGYSSNVQETYQMYLLLEQTTHLGDVTVPAGAYGAGFVGETLMVMDLGGHVVAQGKTQLDDHIARPRPLQLLQSAEGVRLYLGRRWVKVSVEGK